jgi:serine/threonine protein kinase
MNPASPNDPSPSADSSSAEALSPPPSPSPSVPDHVAHPAADPYATKLSAAGQPSDDPAGPPQWIGRYRVERLLGKGGFGVVYLARDEQLQRGVAIKVPHRKLTARPEDVASYLQEARTVAGLNHPHIVPVYDVGSTAQFPCFVVSMYIDGTDLATKSKHARLSWHEAVDVVATVAEALHYAHQHALVHRDIKPGNILLDRSGKAFVADFGLALREQDVGQGPRFAGTPAYMSPEQARGEGHRVHGCSDIFSLGIVFMNCSPDGGHSGAQPWRRCWSRSATSRHARPASGTIPSPGNWRGFV